MISIEKSIRLTTDEVRAYMDGRKTQKRIVIKDKDITNKFDIDVDGKVIAYIDQATGDHYKPEDIAPYQPGDKLWVKETWAYSPNWYYIYRADNNENEKELWNGKIIWRSSIHMHYEDARLFPVVKSIRVERLQDITEEGADAEGLQNYYGARAPYTSNIIRFADYWNSTIKKHDIDKYGWNANPMVWVPEFEKVKP